MARINVSAINTAGPVDAVDSFLHSQFDVLDDIRILKELVT